MISGPHPDFLIIGAQKSGTTSLADTLAERPDVFVTQPREPEYFSRVAAAGRADAMPLADYSALFRAAPQGSLRGEASTGTMLRPEAISEIQRLCPEAKLIVILRRPEDRAWSACFHDVKKGRVRVAEAPGLFRREAEQFLRGEPTEHDWFQRSEYGSLLDPFVQAFGDRLLVVIMEEILADPGHGLPAVQAFLGLPAPFVTSFQAENATRVPAGRLAEKAVAVGRRIVGPVRRSLSERGYRRFRARILALVGRRPASLDRELAERLRSARFDRDREWVEQLLGRPVTAWR